ncbi:MAG: hypothetical protein QOH83_705, partial [Solirubrobacteraceae bacterium]|nr:hypothetical protein [Solirubrobacteraceae bacterium]
MSQNFSPPPVGVGTSATPAAPKGPSRDAPQRAREAFEQHLDRELEPQGRGPGPRVRLSRGAHAPSGPAPEGSSARVLAAASPGPARASTPANDT